MLAERVAFGEVSETTDTDAAVTAILSGGTAFVIEGMEKII